MEQAPWQYYFGIFNKRAVRVPPSAFGRSEILSEAAHDAYQTTTNHLTETGWDAEEALTVTRMFGQVVKDWLAREETDLQLLQEHLREHYDGWKS